jgi:fucose permease
MRNANLIIGDVLFALGLILILITGTIKDYGIIVVPLLIIAFASCLVRHINNYNKTGRYF